MKFLKNKINNLFDKSYYENTYKLDKNGIYEILVGLSKYEDIYSDWDPSPFKKRDIDEDFIDYIWDSALDIPLNKEIKIAFLIKEELRNENKETQLLKALKTHFLYTLQKSERKYLNEKKRSLQYFFIGVVLALIAYSGIFEKVAIWVKIFEEGIIIGTWVFFWESFYNIFIECGSIREEHKIIKRFLNSEYIFKNK